jgi:hypothetical protein
MLFTAGVILFFLKTFGQPDFVYALAQYLAPSHVNDFGMCISGGAIAIAAGSVGELCFHGGQGRIKWLVIFTILYALPFLYSVLTSDWYVRPPDVLPSFNNAPDAIETYHFDWGLVAIASWWVLVIPGLIAVGVLPAASLRRYTTS